MIEDLFCWLMTGHKWKYFEHTPNLRKCTVCGRWEVYEGKVYMKIYKAGSRQAGKSLFFEEWKKTNKARRLSIGDTLAKGEKICLYARMGSGKTIILDKNNKITHMDGEYYGYFPVIITPSHDKSNE